MANNTRKSAPKDPPVLLVMRRKSIRQFPDGQRVALYFIDKLNKFVSVPFDSKGNVSLTFEETEEPSILDQLEEIVSESVSKRIVFEDGSNMLVDKFIANDVLWIFNNLNEENKTQLNEKIKSSKDDFKNIVEFSKKYKK
jgi:hypothetical protein